MRKGQSHSEDTKRAISRTMRLSGNAGRPRGIPCSEETKRKISEANTGDRNPMFGYVYSEGDRKKQRVAHLGLSGYRHTEEARRKISEAKLGQNHPNWKGGISNEPYPFRFNEELKSRIRKRDNHKCQLCGVPQAECITALDVHHIDYDKENIADENLISLCGSCNVKVNSNRGYWQQYFTNRIRAEVV